MHEPLPPREVADLRRSVRRLNALVTQLERAIGVPDEAMADAALQRENERLRALLRKLLCCRLTEPLRGPITTAVRPSNPKSTSIPYYFCWSSTYLANAKLAVNAGLIAFNI